MKKIYDETNQRAGIYANVPGSTITLTALNVLLEEIKKDFPLEQNIQVHFFGKPEYTFRGFGVSVVSKNRPKKYKEGDTWFS